MTITSIFIPSEFCIIFFLFKVWSNHEFLSLYHINEEKKLLYDSLVYLFMQGSYDQAALIFGFSTCTVLHAYCLDRDIKEKEKKRKRFGGCIRDRLNLGKLNTWGCKESKLLGKFLCFI